MKSFHVVRKVQIASVARIGVIISRTIKRSMRASLAPSIRAASSRSSGIEITYYR